MGRPDRPAAGTGDAGGGYGVVGAGELPDAPGHAHGHLAADGAVVGGDLVGHAQHRFLEPAGVGDDTAGEVARTAGDGAQHVANQPAGAGLGHGYGLAGLGQLCGNLFNLHFSFLKFRGCLRGLRMSALIRSARSARLRVFPRMAAATRTNALVAAVHAGGNYQVIGCTDRFQGVTEVACNTVCCNSFQGVRGRDLHTGDGGVLTLLATGDALSRTAFICPQRLFQRHPGPGQHEPRGWWVQLSFGHLYAHRVTVAQP